VNRLLGHLKGGAPNPAQQPNETALSILDAKRMAELKATATLLCAPGKGFLASDESAGPWLRAGHAEAAKIPDTKENRAAYRSMCFRAPGLGQYISGCILHWETLFQSDAEGNTMVDLLNKAGIVPGIKLDKGYSGSYIPGTKKGPLGHAETVCLGLDDLKDRAAKAYKQGARFAKWRNVLQIDPVHGLPSDLSIAEATTQLAKYAAICQAEGLVPIVEPEVVPNGSHDIYACQAATERVLAAQFHALSLHGVYLEGAVLKPNMVKAGLKGPQASDEEVATMTVTTLLRTVPAAMPGIFFLSGDMPQNCDNEETASIHLSKMNELFPKLPWHLSFSYGKALQKTTIVTWATTHGPKKDTVAQSALLARSHANSDAVRGRYVKGTCPSVGIDGNIQSAAGPY